MRLPDFPPAVIDAALDHARACAPRECCGVIVLDAASFYLPCANIAQGNEHFVIDPHDYAAAEDLGRILAVVHSHVNVPVTPSMVDRLGCEKSGLPWIIVQVPHGHVHKISPTGYRAPLLGRPFVFGVLDCYSLIRDYYAQTLGIDLPDFERSAGWEQRGEDLYLRNFARAGFTAVDGDPREHDVMLMAIPHPVHNPSGVTNHGAVYLGDDVMMHHLHGRLSERTVYGGFYRKATTRLLRHRSRLAG